MGPAFVKRRMLAELGPGCGRSASACSSAVPAAAASLGQVHCARTRHLTKRGGGGRHPLERAEALLPARTKLGEHAPLDEGRPHGRRRRLELLQFRGKFRRQQIGDRRHQLGELHHRPLEATERGDEVRGIPRVGQIAAEEPRARHARRHAADIGAHPRIAGQAAGEAVLFAIGGL